MQPASVSPVPPGERIAAFDILRGLALFGILVVNMRYFAHPFTAAMSSREPAGPLDQAARIFIALLFEGKFIALFALLFGLGLSIQLERGGDGTLARYRRRLWGLLLIGALHALLIWAGDILLVYALLGFILIRFRRQSPDRLRLWIAGFLAVPVLIAAGYLTYHQNAARTVEGAQRLRAEFTQTDSLLGELTRNAYLTYSSGTFLEITAQRLAELALAHGGLLTSGGYFPVLALFLCGLAAGRAGLAAGLTGPVPGSAGPEPAPAPRDPGLPAPGEYLLRRLVWATAPAGLLLSALAAFLPSPYDLPVPPWHTLLQSAGAALNGPVLGLAYAAGLLLLLRDPDWHRRLQPFGAAGRMALTNYLGQSLICTMLFYSYGLGLYGRVSAAAGLPLATAIFAAQVHFSRWWLSRFRYGPLEWLWRSFTYRQLQPWRL